MKFTTDIWFAAFLLSKSYVIKTYDVISKNRVKCNFEISESTWQELKLEYSNSEVAKIRTLVEKVKDLSY